MASTSDAASFYEAHSSSKSFRSVSKERSKNTRDRLIGTAASDVRGTVWSNTGRSQTHNRQGPGMKTAENRSAHTSASHSRRVGGSSTRNVEETVVVPTPPPPSPRGTDNDHSHSGHASN
ncbi:unnamed protein product [Echinostoma caproni]|uniref:Uncharacterized protein n=1 Tax=Echinostoma caproni TaxID=27848 RepID=A0A183AA51_9TREM|nr:unnamed protein product [Echinostoma caproni]